MFTFYAMLQNTPSSIFTDSSFSIEEECNLLGYKGSGDTSCIASSSCLTDNGGCDSLVTCSENTGGDLVCGDCPSGYSGDGATGCVDEDWCAQGAGCYPGVHCSDRLAPATGYDCGPCPSGMAGNGTHCAASACWDANGGCDLQVTCEEAPEMPEGRVCGPCPSGYSDLTGVGAECTDTDACAETPCYPGVTCVDQVAPASGYMCGDCPPGLQGDGVECGDIDECALDEGGCWMLEGAVDPVERTECVNTVGGYRCTPCPDGLKGSGKSGCRPVVNCTVDNGGCDPRSDCYDTAEGTACGPCGAGYSGSGDTECVDTDACAVTPPPCFIDPLYAAAECIDEAPPLEGYSCGACPEGYRGDGVSCELCTLSTAITDSSVVDGQVFRSQLVQVKGQMGDLEEGCINTLGMQFRWVAVSSASGPFALSAETNKATTLTLVLPAGTLEARTRYTFRLEAWLTGEPRVGANTTLEAFVQQEALEALVAGGGSVIGEDTEVNLDGSVSVDPDASDIPMSYAWACTVGGRKQCRDHLGKLLPSTLTNATLHLRLQGTVEGLVYTWRLTVSKAQREDSVTTTVTVKKGAPPVPVISPIQGKPNPTEKLWLTSEVRTVGNATVLLRWSCGEVDLEDAGVLASEGTAAKELVLLPNTLSAGVTYNFLLTATLASDPSSLGSSALAVMVNERPRGGNIMVDPLEGVSLETSFMLTTDAWVDEDEPLDFYFAYAVLGANTSQVVLSGFGPAKSLSAVMPEEGTEENDWRVELFVYARDRHGATSDPQVVSVRVTGPVLESEEVVTEYTGALISRSEEALINGDTDAALNIARGSASLLSTPAASRRLQRRRHLASTTGNDEVEAEDEMRSAERAEQRVDLLHLTANANAKITLMSENQQRIAGLVGQLVDCPPSEVSSESLSTALEVLHSVVDSTQRSAHDATSPITTTLAHEVFEGLDSLSANSSTAAEVQAILEESASAFLQTLATGEVPAEVATGGLQLRTQRDQLSGVGSTAGRLFGEVVASPGEGGSQVVLPEALQDILVSGGQTTVETRLLVMASDPHSNTTTNRSSSWASQVTTIALSNDDGIEVAVHNLTKPIDLNLTVEINAPEGQQRRAEDLPLTCSFWDTEREVYATEGCVTLPNPTPPGAALFWREEVWEALGKGEKDREAGVSMEGSWGWHHGSLLAGCVEWYGVADPWYNGTDIGQRKYRGEGCAASDVENQARCAWNWTVAGFMGTGCELATVLHCRCNHLTDFKVLDSVGSFEQTPEMNLLTIEDLTSFNAEEDFAKNTLFLTVLGAPHTPPECQKEERGQERGCDQRGDSFRGQMEETAMVVGVRCGGENGGEGREEWSMMAGSMAGAAIILMAIFDWDDDHKRSQRLQPLISPRGTSRFWHKVLSSGLHTWGLFEEEKDTAVIMVKDIELKVKRDRSMKEKMAKWSRATEPTSVLADMFSSIASPAAARKAAQAGFEHEDDTLQVKEIVARAQAAFRSQALNSVAQASLSMTDDHAAARPGSTGLLEGLDVMALVAQPVLSPRSEGQVALGAERAARAMSALKKHHQTRHRGGRGAEGTLVGHAVRKARHWASLMGRRRSPPRRAGELWQKALKLYRQGRIVDRSSSRVLAHCCEIPFNFVRLAVPIHFLRAVVAEQPPDAEECLSMERMLGTAMVLAFLTKMNLLESKELARQTALAKAQQWALPPGRTFEWFINVFREMQASDLSGPGWIKKVELWNLVLLQFADGSFAAGSGDLATALYAGEPESGVVMRFSYKAIASSLPPVLKTIIKQKRKRLKTADTPDASPKPDGTGLSKIRDGDQDEQQEVYKMSSLTMRIWATLLAVARYNSLPFAWCTNPEAAPSERRYLNDDAEDWLTARATEIPSLPGQLEELREAACLQVQEWACAHTVRLQKLKEVHVPSGMKVVRPQWRYRTARKLNEWMARAAKVHPLLMLKYIGFNDAFSRSERVLMLFTNWIIAMTFSVGFYYSKATQCCEGLKAYLECDTELGTSCTVNGTVYSTCGDLASAADDVEVIDSYTCTAFPQNTLIAKIYLVLIMCVLLIPLRTILTCLFSLSGTAPPPRGQWTIKIQQVSKVFGPRTAALVQAISFVVYAVFRNFDKFNKAVAGVVGFFGITLLMPLMRVAVQPVRRAASACSNCSMPLWLKRDAEQGQRMGVLMRVACGVVALLAVLYAPVHRKLCKSPIDTCIMAIVLMLWLMVVYVLLVYGSLIYDYYGPAAGPLVLLAWVYGVLFDLFGTEGMRAITVKMLSLNEEEDIVDVDDVDMGDIDIDVDADA
ncbi:hypothetical protein CYMTET_19974 [Cymbomonas tetramitiformis]|uniref:EGF-like domain-containing protein n=1 Tax=Cymbomonas tetramitiformis TaxID=36881 RepID=A0AAE0G4Z1_9CHLO|nr:hypothetical protein CYMTET_19974 [Cymbomonas tetramitiformis]